MKRSLFILCATLAVLGISLLAALMLDVFRYAYLPLAINQETRIELSSGTSLKQFANELVTQGVINKADKTTFIVLGRIRGDATHLQSGEYLFHSGTTAYQLLRKIRRGKTIRYQITFLEGWRFNEIKKRLLNDQYLKQTIVCLSDHDILSNLAINKNSLEGLFYPDTYFYRKGTEDKDILLKAYKKMQKILLAEWENRADNGIYRSPYDALISASIIEKESKYDDERFYIAGVIANRLRKNMPLQVDPTVIYAMGDNFQGKLQYADLKIDSPYNTYLHRGLPPTPIGMPSQQSIHAALHPANEDYLYYVAQDNARHLFSTTYSQHLSNIKYIKEQQQTEDRDDEEE